MSKQPFSGWAAQSAVGLPLAGWLVLRSLTSLWAALVSTLKPLQPVETRLALWPPSSPIGEWLYRVFVSPLDRWDVGWYRRILVGGYRPDDGTASFHPLFPWAARVFHFLGLDPTASLLLAASLASLGLLLAWTHLARLDLDEEDARQSLFLFLAAPLAFILFVPYTEGLFLLLSVLCFYWTRRRRWLLGGLAGGLAVLTRQQGLLLAIVMLWELWASSRKDPRALLANRRGWFGTALIPLALALWLLYRGIVLGDLALDPRQPGTFLHAFLISSSHAQVVPVFRFVPPWEALGSALQKLRLAPDVDIATNLVLGAYFVALLAVAWRKLNPGYRLYSLAIVLVSVSYHTGTTHPYMGLLRHLWLAFPVYIGLPLAVRRPWARLAIAGSGIVTMLFLLMLYGLEAWVP